jgi:hypothetical protein
MPEPARFIQCVCGERFLLDREAAVVSHDPPPALPDLDDLELATRMARNVQEMAAEMVGDGATVPVQVLNGVPVVDVLDALSGEVRRLRGQVAEYRKPGRVWVDTKPGDTITLRSGGSDA